LAEIRSVWGSVLNSESETPSLSTSKKTSASDLIVETSSSVASSVITTDLFEDASQTLETQSPLESLIPESLREEHFWFASFIELYMLLESPHRHPVTA